MSSPLSNNTIFIPASKSLSQRAIAAAMISKGTSKLYNIGRSDDELVALKIAKDFGCDVLPIDNGYSITPPLEYKKNYTIHCGESGLAARLFVGLFCGIDATTTMDASGSLLRRPMNLFPDFILSKISSLSENESSFPIQIEGVDDSDDITISGKMSSQVITGILFYCSMRSTRTRKVLVVDMTSTPYIDMTISTLNTFGASIIRNNDTIHIHSPSILTGQNLLIESDWSSAAFILVAAAIFGDASIANLSFDSLQGDKKILQILSRVGALILHEKETIKIKRNELKAFEYNANDTPDLIPALAVLAAYCHGTSIIYGIDRLTHKESHRADCIYEAFDTLGIKIYRRPNCFEITGPISHDFLKLNRGKTIQTRNDHRMLMAFYLLIGMDTTIINLSETDSISKSFPNFFELIHKINKTH